MLTAHMDGVHSVMWLCRVGAASCTTCLAYYLVLYSAVAALELHNRCWLVDALRSDPCAAGVCAPAGMLLLAIAWVRLERLRIILRGIHALPLGSAQCTPRSDTVRCLVRQACSSRATTSRAARPRLRACW